MTSLEVSRRLYEVFPEWDDTGNLYCLTCEEGVLEGAKIDDITTHHSFPLYSSDYLLERLPERTDDIRDTVMLGRATDNKGWSVVYRDFCCIADTPADALALLAIKLREKGVL